MHWLLFTLCTQVTTLWYVVTFMLLNQMITCYILSCSPQAWNSRLIESTEPICQPYCSLQNKIWNLPVWSTILPKFIYGKEGKLARWAQVLPVRVHGPSLILKTDIVQLISHELMRCSDAIWPLRSWSTLAQVIAWCLTAPSHYLNQYWLVITEVEWHSSESNFTRDTSAINHQN